MSNGINALIATGGGYRPPDFDYATARRNALAAEGQGIQNELLRARMAQMPEEREYLRTQRGREASGQEFLEKQRGWAEEDRQRELESRPLKDMREAVTLLQQVVPMISYENYAASYDHLQKVNKLGDFIPLPPPEQVEQMGPEGWQRAQIEFMSPEVQAKFADLAMKASQPEKSTFGAPQKGIDENGKPIVYQVDKDGKIRVLQGVQPTPTKGMKIYDREGNLMVDTTGGAGPAMTPKTKGAIEDKLLGAKEHLGRIETIKSKYKEEYHQIKPRVSAAWTGLKSKFGGDIPKEEKEKLSGLTDYLRTTISNLNRHIKEMTGAQMSEKEAGRLSLEEPKAGQSWWDFAWKGDSPIELESKIDSIEKAERASIARLEYYLRKGLTESEIEKIVKNPNDSQYIALEDLISRIE